MTAFSSTIRNTVLVFGPEPTEKWAVTGTSGTTPLIWGTDKWAYGTVGLPTDFTKGIFNSQEITNVVGKGFSKGIVDNTFTVSNAITGKDVLKGVFNSQEVTNSVGKNMMHFYDNATVMTTAVGKDMFISVYGDLPLIEDISRNLSWNKTLSSSFIISSTIPAIYSLRDGYYLTNGGISNVVSWPRATIYTSTTRGPLTWSNITATTTTWV